MSNRRRPTFKAVEAFAETLQSGEFLNRTELEATIDGDGLSIRIDLDGDGPIPGVLIRRTIGKGKRKGQRRWFFRVGGSKAFGRTKAVRLDRVPSWVRDMLSAGE